MRAPLAIALATATLVAGGACSTQRPKPVTVAAVLAVSHHHDVPEPPTTTTVAVTTTRPQPAVAMTWPPAPHKAKAHQPSGNRQACILARENGGDYGRSTNPSHFGAYQFDHQTWASAGGDPTHWGTASPAEQDAAFNNYVSKYGYGAWAPYDGC